MKKQINETRRMQELVKMVKEIVDQYYVHDEEGLEEPIGPFTIDQAKQELAKLGPEWKLIDAETAKEIWSHLNGYYVHDEEGLEEPIGPFTIDQAKQKLAKLGPGWKMMDAETAKEIWSHLNETKKIKTVKKQINEVRRMQQLAGILKENEMIGEEADIRGLVQTINNAKKAGQTIAVNGEAVTLWIPMNGRLRTPSGTYSIHDVISGDVELTIDGQPVAVGEVQPKPIKPQVDTRTQSQKDADAEKWMDRYGPGGGYDTGFGRYTGD